MEGAVIVNGKLIPAGQAAIGLDNRAFHYADGLFESIRVVHGKACFLDAHWTRLIEGMKVLRIEQPNGLDERSLIVFINRLIEENGLPNGRLRITVFRDSPGYFRPHAHQGGFALELEPVSSPVFILNHEGLTVDLYPEMRKAVNMLSVHKTLNCQLYVMASLWCMERGLDDCLLQNDRGNIIESSSGNLFIVSNGVLYTPSLSDGCIGGVMRMQIINLAIANGIKVYECSLNPQNLLAADELFFTNASRGPQWVSGYRTKRYTHRMALHLVDLLVKKVVN
ncbi:MAG: aminotransferase class IV [Flavobacteriales bacterium]|nr:aminotransferase class IV [Flavobacteriales bacterium]